MTVLAQEVEEEVVSSNEDALRTASQLPEPKGYKLLINDDTVEAVVEDPRGVERA